MAFIFSLKWVTGISVLISALHVAHAFWWQLGLSNHDRIIPGNATENPCDNLEFLQPKQKAMCNENPQLINIMYVAAYLSFKECQAFSNDQSWNCPVNNQNHIKVFERILDTKSRYSAYIYALTSAAFTYSLTKACALGQMENCGCANKTVVRFGHGKRLQICPDDVTQGSEISTKFVDIAVGRKTMKGKMEIWNNEVGRKVVQNSRKVRCKCILRAFSSCVRKFCIKRMLSFRKIARILKRKFEQAIQVQYVKKENELSVVMSNAISQPTKEDLIYLKTSLNLCGFSLTHGFDDNWGLECNKTSDGVDGCAKLCCGRYRKVIKAEKSRCNCKFVWCCDVKCQECVKDVEKYYCT